MTHLILASLILAGFVVWTNWSTFANVFFDSIQAVIDLFDKITHGSAK